MLDTIVRMCFSQNRIAHRKQPPSSIQINERIVCQKKWLKTRMRGCQVLSAIVEATHHIKTTTFRSSLHSGYEVPRLTFIRKAMQQPICDDDVKSIHAQAQCASIADYEC
jgi:hypothetical protein